LECPGGTSASISDNSLACAPSLLSAWTDMSRAQCYQKEGSDATSSFRYSNIVASVALQSPTSRVQRASTASHAHAAHTVVIADTACLCFARSCARLHAVLPSLTWLESPLQVLPFDTLWRHSSFDIDFGVAPKQ